MLAFLARLEFYNDQAEFQDHLFFSCYFTKHVWSGVLARFRPHLCAINWASESAWLMEWKGNSLDALHYRLTCMQYAYAIWIEKNRHIFQIVSQREVDLVHDIVDTMWSKVSSLFHLAFQISGSGFLHIWAFFVHGLIALEILLACYWAEKNDE